MRKSRAVIIGPSEYGAKEISGIDSHATIAASARQWEDFLKADPLWEVTSEDGETENRVRRLDRDQLGSIDGVMTSVQDAADEANDMLLVVYVGHGKCWEEVPGKQVHLAVESSRANAPHTWLSSWYLYRAMRSSSAPRKILVADCCWSNALGHLDGGVAEDQIVTEAFNTSRPEGTLVVRAVQHVWQASSEGCPHISTPELRECTPLSGHLLSALRRGMASGGDVLSSRMVVNRFRSEMLDCQTPHPEPGGTLSGSLSDMEMFTNRLPSPSRDPRPAPATAEEWTNALLDGESHHLNQLFDEPPKIVDVVRRLARRPGLGPGIARDVHEQAMMLLSADKLADYLKVRARQAPAT